MKISFRGWNEMTHTHEVYSFWHCKIKKFGSKI